MELCQVLTEVDTRSTRCSISLIENFWKGGQVSPHPFTDHMVVMNATVFRWARGHWRVLPPLAVILALGRDSSHMLSCPSLWSPEYSLVPTHLSLLLLVSLEQGD